MIATDPFSVAASFGAFRVDICGLSLPPGAVAFLHGPSGCGKTSLLRCLAGVWPSSVGDSIRHRFRRVAFVMHEPSLLPWLRVDEHLEVEARLRRVAAPLSAFGTYAESFGLRGVSGRPCASLSLGMRQRVEIAKALAFECDLILIDEGLSGIDLRTRAVVATAIADYARQRNAAIVATAHQVTDVLRLATVVYVLGSGRVRQVFEINEPIGLRMAMSMPELLSLQQSPALMAAGA